MTPKCARGLAAAVLAVVVAGCGEKTAENKPTPPAGAETAGEKREVTVEEVRSKLSPEDRKLVEEQEWCAIMPEERLGSMGAPIKLDLKGKTVFVCCNSCKRKAEKDPDAAVAKAEELKAKKAKQ